jgi:hypothetical protein
VARTQSPSGASRIIGAVLMLLGVGLIGYGVHFLAKNGTCSGTGYASFGPVPKCSGGEALYIISAFFLGPLVALIGWLRAQLSGVLWPAVCVAVGIALVMLYTGQGAVSGGQAFGLVCGACFFALAVLSAVITLRKRRRPRVSPVGMPVAPLPLPGSGPPPVPFRPGQFAPAADAPAAGLAAFRAFDADAGAHAADASAHAGAPPGASAAAADPLDKLAKLAQLRDSGALTQEEFEFQKAKLLAQM